MRKYAEQYFNDVIPPTSNTGVPITHDQKAIATSCSIDWLAVTVYLNPVDVVPYIVPGYSLDDFVIISGRNGYTIGYSFGSLSIYSGGSNQMGTHVVMPSTFLRSQKYHESLESIFMLTTENLCNISRIDLALDINQNYMDIIHESIDNKDYRTKTRKLTKITQLDTADNSIIGDTITIGSRSSDSYMRIYNKQLEQKTNYAWTRMELECKNEKANVVYDTLKLNTIEEVTHQAIYNHIQFLDPEHQVSNISRRRVAKWYMELFELRSIKFDVKRNKCYDLDSRIKWLMKQVSATLAVTDLAVSDQSKFAQALLEYGRGRLTDKDLKQIQSYRDYLDNLDIE